MPGPYPHLRIQANAKAFSMGMPQKTSPHNISNSCGNMERLLHFMQRVEDGARALK